MTEEIDTTLSGCWPSVWLMVYSAFCASSIITPKRVQTPHVLRITVKETN